VGTRRLDLRVVGLLWRYLRGMHICGSYTAGGDGRGAAPEPRTVCAWVYSRAGSRFVSRCASSPCAVQPFLW